jgi:hypothetical protein
MMNNRALLDLGLYEAALLLGLTMSQLNNANWNQQSLSWLVSLADRARLRAAGDPLPGPGPFTVYRGVAGPGPARRVRGLSWTLSLPIAAWFARRASNTFQLDDPAVYRLTVEDGRVLAYDNNRREEEILVLPLANDQPARCLGGDDLVWYAEEFASR